MPRSRRLSDDPVAAFLAAHAAGAPVSLGTSGTSGAARSVVRTTGSWVSSFHHVASLAGLTPSSRVWVPGPLAATMNLFAAVHAAFLGARRVDGPAEATHALGHDYRHQQQFADGEFHGLLSGGTHNRNAENQKIGGCSKAPN